MKITWEQNKVINPGDLVKYTENQQEFICLVVKAVEDLEDTYQWVLINIARGEIINSYKSREALSLWCTLLAKAENLNLIVEG